MLLRAQEQRLERSCWLIGHREGHCRSISLAAGEPRGQEVEDVRHLDFAAGIDVGTKIAGEPSAEERENILHVCAAGVIEVRHARRDKRR